MGTSSKGLLCMDQVNRKAGPKNAYKLSAPLICMDCNRRTKDMGQPIFIGKKGEEKLLGWRCVKCTKKSFVVNRPAGTGWKAAFNRFVNALTKKDAPAK